jgi:hypothetical protein
MWPKNQMNWTERRAQNWESMILELCVTGMACQTRLLLHGIYEWREGGEAEKLSRNSRAWYRAIREETERLIISIARATRVVKGRLKGISACWTRGFTTALLECPNSLFVSVR